MTGVQTCALPIYLALKIQEVREATNWEVPIQLKLGAARVYDDVRMAAKCDPDMIYVDGMEGGTGAGPHLASEETGVPGIAAIRQARKAIDDLGKRGQISLVYAGGIRNGADVAKAIALGADAIAIGRPYLWGLSSFGQEGVETVIDLLTRELEIVMRQAGTLSISDIDRSYIRGA